MAKFNQGILGPISGKLGIVVGASWKGEPYLRSLPKKKRRKSNAKGKLKQNRSKFKTLHYWLLPLVDFLRVGFKGYAPRVEGFNAAKSYGLKNAFTGAEGKQVIDPALIRVSHGDLPLPAFIHVNQVKIYLLEFTWENTVTWRDEHDQVMLLAYDTTDDFPAMKLNGQLRETGREILKLRPNPGRTYHIYAAFVSEDRSRRSNSIYLGTVTT